MGGLHHAVKAKELKQIEAYTAVIQTIITKALQMV
jgi:hypothetical protein